MLNENNKKMTEKINLNFEAKCLGFNTIAKFKSPPEMMDYFDETLNTIMHELKNDNGVLKKLDKF
jgi:hypothetical protein